MNHRSQVHCPRPYTGSLRPTWHVLFVRNKRGWPCPQFTQSSLIQFSLTNPNPSYLMWTLSLLLKLAACAPTLLEEVDIARGHPSPVIATRATVPLLGTTSFRRDNSQCMEGYIKCANGRALDYCANFCVLVLTGRWGLL